MDCPGSMTSEGILHNANKSEHQCPHPIWCLVLSLCNAPAALRVDAHGVSLLVEHGDVLGVESRCGVEVLVMLDLVCGRSRSSACCPKSRAQFCRRLCGADRLELETGLAGC